MKSKNPTPVIVAVPRRDVNEDEEGMPQARSNAARAAAICVRRRACRVQFKAGNSTIIVSAR